MRFCVYNEIELLNGNVENVRDCLDNEKWQFLDGESEIDCDKFDASILRFTADECPIHENIYNWHVLVSLTVLTDMADSGNMRNRDKRKDLWLKSLGFTRIYVIDMYLARINFSQN